jgi:hypothetical protein
MLYRGFAAQAKEKEFTQDPGLCRSQGLQVIERTFVVVLSTI